MQQNMKLPRYPMKFDLRGKHMYFRDDIALFMLGCARKRIYFLHSRADTGNFGKVGLLAFRGSRAYMVLDP